MPGSGRVQIVVSGPFLVLLLLCAGFSIAGFWLYTHPPPPVLPQMPPYYVNRIATAVRPCFQCVGTDGKLTATPFWKLGKSVEIPAAEQWWFAPVEEHQLPTRVDDIPMLAVHPARDFSRPWEGFDQRRVILVVFQDLDGRTRIEHPTPAPTPTPAPIEIPSPDSPQPQKP